MGYIGEFLYWLLIVIAVAAALKGIFVICSKRAIYSGDIFKKIEVTNIKRYNLLNGLLLIGLSFGIAAASLAFKYGSTSLITCMILTCSGIGIAMTRLEKKIEKKYIIMK